MSDTVFMQQAIALAEKGVGYTCPNPPVGAVLVQGAGSSAHVVGRGWHMKAGGDHAEITAIRDAGDQAAAGTLYVTLEPCNHTGRTGPCTQAILEAGISRVVIGVRDPNRNVSGGGAAYLQQQGVDVQLGVCEDEAAWLIRCFAHHSKTGRPWVVAKTASSLDGRVATAEGESKWITSAESRRHAHAVRARTDAILVGVETVLADDPELTARPHPGRQPLRVVLDSTGRTPVGARLVGDQSIVLTTERMPQTTREALGAAGCRVVVCPADGKGRVSVVGVLLELGRLNVQSLLVEGGPTVLGAFHDAGLLNEVHAYVAPFLMGGRDATGSVAGQGATSLATVHRMVRTSVEQLGPDWLLQGCMSDWRGD